jgi:hypothetical protein
LRRSVLGLPSRVRVDDASCGLGRGESFLPELVRDSF